MHRLTAATATTAALSVLLVTGAAGAAVRRLKPEILPPAAEYAGPAASGSWTAYSGNSITFSYPSAAEPSEDGGTTYFQYPDDRFFSYQEIDLPFSRENVRGLTFERGESARETQVAGSAAFRYEEEDGGTAYRCAVLPAANGMAELCAAEDAGAKPPDDSFETLLASVSYGGRTLSN